MKSILIIPPQCPSRCPAASASVLAGCLNDKGVDVSIIDMNIDFYHYLLSQTNLEKIYDNIKNEYDNINKNYDKDKLTNKQISLISIMDRYDTIYKSLIKNIDFYINIRNDKKKFYNPFLYRQVLYVIDLMLKLVSIDFYPFEISLYDYINREKNLLFEDYVKFASGKENIFSEYFREQIKNITASNVDLIGISIGNYSQLIAGLTLSRMIKESGIKSHIVIGGGPITRLQDEIINNTEFFDTFADYAAVGDGYQQIVQLAEYLNGETDIRNVANIIYKNNNGQTMITQASENKPEIPKSFYKGIDFDKYFLPERFLSLSIYNCCYWNKCTFCDINHKKAYVEKSLETIIAEIKEIQEKYGIKYFYFTDPAIPASFLEKFSRKIIEDKIEMYYTMNLRLDKDFNKKLLKQLFKSGLRACNWGMESGSNRVLRLMNKGVTKEGIIRVMKDSYNAGIRNHMHLMLGFPGETQEDIDETVTFIKKYKKYISSIACGKFMLLKNSYIFSHPEEFNIPGEFIDIAREEGYCDITPDNKDLYKLADDLNNLCKKTTYESVLSGTLEEALLYAEKYPLKYADFYKLFFEIQHKLKINLYKLF